MIDGRRNRKRAAIGQGLGGCEGLVNRAGRSRLSLLANATREIPLRIHIDQQDALVSKRQGSREIDGRGGLSHATFLISDSDNASHIGLMTENIVAWFEFCGYEHKGGSIRRSMRLCAAMFHVEQCLQAGLLKNGELNS